VDAFTLIFGYKFTEKQVLIIFPIFYVTSETNSNALLNSISLT